MNHLESSLSNFPSVDVLIEGFNINGGLMTLSALKMGVKVGVILPDNFINSSFQPELSSFYPQKITESINAIKNYNFSLKCSTLKPSLFLPQRVLTFSTTTNRNIHFNNTIDKLLGRDRESASLPINSNNYAEFKSFSKHYTQGSLVYEYRFDRKQYEIELLKLCIEHGLVIFKNTDSVGNRLIIKCNPFQHKNYTIEINNYKWPLKNHLTIKHNNFTLTVMRVFDHTLVEIIIGIPLTFDAFQNQINDEFKKLNIPTPNNFETQLRTIFDHTNHINSPLKNVFEDSNLSQLRTDTHKLNQYISSVLAIDIKSNNVFDLFKNEAMNSANFRNIQSECDEKFDLAKQTGIDYLKFTHLFYRYRDSIDQLIDAAYEKMNEERNPQIIWNKTEQEYIIQEKQSIVDTITKNPKP